MIDSASKLSWVDYLSEERLDICVDLNLYSLQALFRVCYWFTDQCYLFISSDQTGYKATVHFAAKTAGTNLPSIAAEFSNELINQKVRLDVAAETRAIRELIVAQAFAEADLLDRSGVEADYHEDPKDIAK